MQMMNQYMKLYLTSPAVKEKKINNEIPFQNNIISKMLAKP